MKFRIDNGGFSLHHQGIRSQFYFQLDWGRKYLFRRLFQIHFKSGISKWTHIQYPWDEVKHTHIETIGPFVDLTVFNLRIGIYLHPIIVSKK